MYDLPRHTPRVEADFAGFKKDRGHRDVSAARLRFNDAVLSIVGGAG